MEKSTELFCPAVEDRMSLRPWLVKALKQGQYHSFRRDEKPAES